MHELTEQNMALRTEISSSLLSQTRKDLPRIEPCFKKSILYDIRRKSINGTAFQLDEMQGNFRIYWPTLLNRDEVILPYGKTRYHTS